MAATVFSKVDEIPQSYLDLLPVENRINSVEFLKSFENCSEGLRQEYLCIEQGRNQALAVLQYFEIDLSELLERSTLQNQNLFKAGLKLIGDKVSVSICGNLFISYDLPIYYSDEAFTDRAIKLVEEFLIENTSSPFLFFKDFPAADPCIAENTDFKIFSAESNMVIDIHSEWKNLEDYKNDLKSKYRVKVNRALTLSQDLKAYSYSAQEIDNERELLQQLLDQVTMKGSFHTSRFEITTYLRLKEKFGDDFIFTTYLMDDVIVGFRTAFRESENLYSHFIGMSPNYQKSHALYSRILIDYIEDSIKYKVQRLNLGRTTTEFKSTLGAYPVDLHSAVRHKQRIKNYLIQKLIDARSVQTLKIYKPFKKKHYESHME